MTAPAWATYDVLEWGEIPGTYQTGSAGDVTSAGGNTLGVQARLNYSGMALTSAGEVVLAGCGGHTDYHSNEVARCPLNDDVPAWVLGNAPSATLPNGTPYATDGKPAAMHTYWDLLEVGGKIYRAYTRFAGDTAYNGGESNIYDLATDTWAAAGTMADAPSTVSTIDSSGNLWGNTANDLRNYVVSTNTWLTIHSSSDITGSPLVYDPTTDDFFVFCWGDGLGSFVGGGPASTTAFRVSKLGVKTAVTINSSAAYTEWQAIQAIYHQVIKDPNDSSRWFVFSPVGSGTGQNKIYTLTLNSGTYDMAVLATTGLALPACNTDGVMNRLQYSSALEGLVYMPRGEINMLFLRLTGTPAPGRTMVDSTLKFLTKLQDSLPTEIISGRTITKVGGCALDGSGEGFAFSSGAVLTVASFPYFAPPFTMGVRLKQASGSGDNVGMIGLNIDSDAKVFTLHLDTNNNAHAWSRGSDIGDAAQTFNAFAYDEWITYAAVFHADGSRSVYDSTCGMVSNSDIIDMTGSGAELYIGSYPRSDTPWTANGLEAWIFFFTTDKTKGDLDLVDANPDSLLVASLPDVTGTGASTQGAQVSVGTGAVGVAGTAASTQGLQVSAATAANRVSGAGASTQGAQVSTGTGAVQTTGTIAETQGLQVSAAAGAVAISGAAASTQGPQVGAATGAIGISGSAADTQGLQISAGSGFVSDLGSIIGAGASTQGLQVSAAAGTVAISGTATSAQGPQVSAGSGDVEDDGTSTGTAASVQGKQVSAATGAVGIAGTAASTQRPQISTGVGRVGDGSDPTPVLLSVPQAIFAALRSLVDDRVYPNEFPQGDPLPIWPAIRYTIVVGDPSPTIAGSDDEDTDDVVVFIDVVAKTYPSMRALKAQVIEALQSTDPPCARESGGQEGPDGETRTHRVVMTYRFQQSSAS